MKLYAAILFLAALPPPVAQSFQAAVLTEFAPSTRSVSVRPQPSSTLLLRAVKEDQASSTPVVTRLENSAVAVDIPVPGSATKAAYDKVCTELSKQVQIPGFRKGSKIPPPVLEQSMAAKGGRNALKVQAINELLGQLVEPALKEQALDPIGQPTLKVPAEELADSFKPGEDLTLQVQCDVWPEIDWKKIEGQEKPYTGLTGKYKRKPFSKEKLDKALNDLRERYATLEPISDASHVLAMGDACTVNMVGYMATSDNGKGDPLPNAASGDNVEVILGTGRYMEGLVEGLEGAKVGDTVTVSVTFPDKLRDKTLAGKKAIFDVDVLEASKRTVPEVTDEFSAKVKPGLTAESLTAELRKAIDEEDSKEFVPARNKVLGQSLAEVMDVEVPDTLITNQAREKFAVMMSEMRDGGVSDEEIKKQINPDNFNKYKDIVKDDIVRDFKISMATDEIARLEGITVPDYQIEEQMESIRKDADGSEDFDENMVRAKVETTMQRQAVMDWLAEQSQLEVEYSEEEEFDESLMEGLAEESLKREEEIISEQPASEAPTAAAVATEEPSPAPSAAPSAPSKDTSSELSLQEQAFQALVNSGAVELNKSPDDPDYDPSRDDDEAEGTVYKK